MRGKLSAWIGGASRSECSESPGMVLLSKAATLARLQVTRNPVQTSRKKA